MLELDILEIFWRYYGSCVNEIQKYFGYLPIDVEIDAQSRFLQGAPKSNPLGKIRYLWNCSRFFHQIYSVYR